MDDPNEFRKLLRQIMSQECKPLMSEEDIVQIVFSIKLENETY